MESRLSIILDIVTRDPEVEKRLILAVEDGDLELIKSLTRHCDACTIFLVFKSTQKEKKHES